MRLVHIFARDIFRGDAVGNFALHLNHKLRVYGFQTRLFAENFDTEERELISRPNEMPADNDDATLFYNFSIGDPNLEYLLSIKGRKICYFHGISPPSKLLSFDASAAAACEIGINQIPLLKSFDRILANSKFSINQLKSHGLDINAEVIPPVLENRQLKRLIAIPYSSKDKTNDILHVGRIAPHKNIEMAIEIANGLLHQGWTGNLLIVGSGDSSDYAQHLKRFASAVNSGKHIRFLGFQPEKELAAYFEKSAILISTSKHEGFCIPALEALCAGIPLALLKGTASEEHFGEYADIFATTNEAVPLILARLQQRNESSLGMGRQHAKDLLDISNQIVRHL